MVRHFVMSLGLRKIKQIYHSNTINSLHRTLPLQMTRSQSIVAKARFFHRQDQCHDFWPATAMLEEKVIQQKSLKVTLSSSTLTHSQC